MAAFDSEWIWLGGDVGVLYGSQDGGVSWEEVTVPNLSPNVPVHGFAFLGREVILFTESLRGRVRRGGG